MPPITIVEGFRGPISSESEAPSQDDPHDGADRDQEDDEDGGWQGGGPDGAEDGGWQEDDLSDDMGTEPGPSDEEQNSADHKSESPPNEERHEEEQPHAGTQLDDAGFNAVFVDWVPAMSTPTQTAQASDSEAGNAVGEDCYDDDDGSRVLISDLRVYAEQVRRYSFELRPH